MTDQPKDQSRLMAACRPVAKFGILPLIAALVPPAAPWIAENPEAGVTVVCGLLAGIDWLVDRLAPRRAPAAPAPTPTPPS